MEKEQIQIFGHKSPDTDSVAAAIALSYLKNKLGLNTVPRILGELNDETKYILKKFNFKKPTIIESVASQIKDIPYHINFSIEENESIYNAYIKMSLEEKYVIPTVDKHNKLTGILSIKEIMHNEINENNKYLDTTYDKILKTLDATEITRFDNFIKGEILIAATRSTNFLTNIKLSKDKILLVGDRHSLIEYAIESKIKLLIITTDSIIKQKHIDLAKENKVNIIRTSLRSFNTAKKIGYSNPVKSISTKSPEVICINENKTVKDFITEMSSINYSNYPVLDDSNKYLGLFETKNITQIKRKKVILVDHNEFGQSADGIEDAEILEIIDHHKIGNDGTNSPISFRNMAVGSTNTIIYLLYKEHNIDIPKEIASLMMAGIISDTLILTSPTTSPIDISVIKELENITGLDKQEFGIDIFKAGSSIKGKKVHNLLTYDLKKFTIKEEEIGIAQFFSLNVDDFKKIKKDIIIGIEELKTKEKLNHFIFAVTDIISGGTYLYFDESYTETLKYCFDLVKLDQGDFFKNMVSRKKQIIPPLMTK